MYITYQITHKVSKKFYIGKTSLAKWDKGYMGSGLAITRAVNKYGPDAFYRAILNTFDNEEDAYNDEACRVDAETFANPMCYNMCGGGGGLGSGEAHLMHGTKRPEHSAYMKDNRTGEDNPMYGRKRADITAIMKGRTGKNNPMYGRKRPDTSAIMADRHARVALGCFNNTTGSYYYKSPETKAGLMAAFKTMEL